MDTSYVQLLTIVNNAAINVGAQISVQDPAFIWGGGIYPQVE